MTLLLACAIIATIACANTAPAVRRVDTAVAEGWDDSFSLATVDTYRLRAGKLAACAPLPEPSSNWVTHALPGLPGAKLSVPPELVESTDTLPDSTIASEFTSRKAYVQVMFSPHGNDSPATLPTGCGARVAGFETPLHMNPSPYSGAFDSVFDAQVDFALEDSVGVHIALATATRGARDSLLAVFRSLEVPSRRVSARPQPIHSPRMAINGSALAAPRAER